jgi:hypothetical protein
MRREFGVPILLAKTEEAGFLSLNLRGSRRRSRKWKSGHAASALVLLRHRGQFTPLTFRQLGEPILPGQWNRRFPLTFTYHGLSVGSMSGRYSAFFVTMPSFDHFPRCHSTEAPIDGSVLRSDP